MAQRFPPPGTRQDARSFAHPREIIASSLDRDAKLKLLEEWDQDLRRMLTASDENMPGTVPGETGETLRAVTDALIALGASSGDTPAVPTADGTNPRSSQKSS